MAYSLIGGLQSATNPGRNMASTGYRPRLPRRPRRIGGALGGNRPPTGGGGRPNNPTGGNPQGTPVSPQPHGTAPALPPAPVSSLLSFADWLKTNPIWTAQAASSAAQRNNLMASYGWEMGPDGKLRQATNAAPDSILAGLGNDLSVTKSRGAQRAANAGTLFSGGTINEVDKATQAYERGVAAAQTSLIGKLGGIDSQDIATQLDLQPNYDEMVQNTKVRDPGDVVKEYSTLKPDVGIAAIDQYLKAYEKFLTPQQAHDFHLLRDQLYKTWLAQHSVAGRTMNQAGGAVGAAGGHTGVAAFTPGGTRPHVVLGPHRPRTLSAALGAA